MRRHPRADWWLAAALAMLAGCVDAIGFLRAGGMFVSFMSGNTTRLAVDAVARQAAAFTAAGLILGFLAGVVVGAVIAQAAGRWQRPAVIAATALLLALAAALSGWPLAVVLLAVAMGVLNAVFERGGEVSIGVTYMTGTLVKLGQNLSAALMGPAPRAAWVPYLLLWSGLAAGAVAGAAAYGRYGTAMLWVAAGAAALLALATVPGAAATGRDG